MNMRRGLAAFLLFVLIACNEESSNSSDGGVITDAELDTGSQTTDGGGSSSSPWSCSYSEAVSDEHCGCEAIPPVDIHQTDPTLELWPFGVHARSGHTEGHRGLDFVARVPDTTEVEVEVVAPVDGTITNLDNSQDSSGGLAEEYDLTDTSVHFTKITADCGMSVVFIPLKLDEGITEGMHIVRGQRLGVLPKTRHGESGTNTYSSHFEFDVDPEGDMAYYAVCPAVMFDEESQATIQTLTAASRYDERLERTVSIECESGGPTDFTYPAEDQACNPRLSDELREALSACLPSRASTIW